MATDDGAIPGESESTDGLIDQYRRYYYCSLLVSGWLQQWKAHANKDKLQPRTFGMDESENFSRELVNLLYSFLLFSGFNPPRLPSFLLRTVVSRL